VLTAALVLAACVAGLTGAWSPCGFSMVSTLGEHAGGRRATLAACAAFVPGAALGGVVTFGALAALGALLGGGDAALVGAAVIALAAAVAEAAGLKIAPQIRRQVPEHWRRVLPLPLAAAGYGVLLGLGFTTFVLTFAVWALAGVALAVGDVSTGVLVGLAFAVGRSIPVVVLAPFAQAPLGSRATELMAERPAIYRGFRAADALALALCALALTAQTANAATRAWVDRASDPSVAGAEVAWRIPGAQSALAGPAGVVPVAAERVAIGGALTATLDAGRVTVSERASGTVRTTFPAPGATGIAVSDRWVALRLSTEQGDALQVTRLADGATRTVARSAAPAQLGRPALDGDRMVFHLAGRTSSRLEEADLAAATRRTIRSDRRRTLTNPSLLGDRLLYVETTHLAQALVLGTRAGERGRTLLRIAPSTRADKGFTTKHGPHRPGIPRPRRPAREGPAGSTTTLWTTALGADAAYVTRLRAQGTSTRAALLRVAVTPAP
jgi:hypothetical protein